MSQEVRRRIKFETEHINSISGRTPPLDITFNPVILHDDSIRQRFDGRLFLLLMSLPPLLPGVIGEHDDDEEEAQEK